MYDFYWNFTSCVRSDSRNNIRWAIINLLEREIGCYLLPKLPYLVINTEKLRWLTISERPPLLMVGLGIGREGWTIIKTYPNDWFFLRTPDGKRPRLSALAMKLKCDAFHFRVINGMEGLLLETDSNGKFRFDCTKDPSFSLIEISERLQKAMLVKQNPEIIRRESVFLAEFNKQKAKGKIDLELLANMSEGLGESSLEQIDTALAITIDPFQNYWHSYDLFDQIYNNYNQLEEMNVKFLYFYPPDNYLQTLPIYRD